jgi:hypothetical protein
VIRLSEREFTRMVDEAISATEKHVFANPSRCCCGFAPITGEDWNRHRIEESLKAALFGFADVEG